MNNSAYVFQEFMLLSLYWKMYEFFLFIYLFIGKEGHWCKEIKWNDVKPMHLINQSRNAMGKKHKENGGEGRWRQKQKPLLNLAIKNEGVWLIKSEGADKKEIERTLRFDISKRCNIAPNLVP